MADRMVQITLRFQSTHLHEVRQGRRVSRSKKVSFNPRTYMRCDRYRKHTASALTSFNPRTYMRCDSRTNVIFRDVREFQSTHLHEVRRKSHRTSSTLCSFNPRTYMRCDTYSMLPSDKPDLFQSTHLHEVRPTQSDYNKFMSLFQSTHLHEVRLLKFSNSTAWFCFNPRTYMRCDMASAFRANCK